MASTSTSTSIALSMSETKEIMSIKASEYLLYWKEVLMIEGGTKERKIFFFPSFYHQS